MYFTSGRIQCTMCKTEQQCLICMHVTCIASYISSNQWHTQGVCINTVFGVIAISLSWVQTVWACQFHIIDERVANGWCMDQVLRASPGSTGVRQVVPAQRYACIERFHEPIYVVRCIGSHVITPVRCWWLGTCCQHICSPCVETLGNIRCPQPGRTHIPSWIDVAAVRALVDACKRSRAAQNILE